MCTFSNTVNYHIKWSLLCCCPFVALWVLLLSPHLPLFLALSLSLSVNLFGHCSRPWPKKAPFKPFVVVPIAVAVVVSGLFTAQHKSAPKTWRCLQPWGHDRSVREMLLNKMQVQKKKLFFCGRFISLFRVHLISFLSSVSGDGEKGEWNWTHRRCTQLFWMHTTMGQVKMVRRMCVHFRVHCVPSPHKMFTFTWLDRWDAQSERNMQDN